MVLHTHEQEMQDARKTQEDGSLVHTIGTEAAPPPLPLPFIKKM